MGLRDPEATAVVEAIRKAGSTDGQKMADTLFGKGPNGISVSR